MADPFATPVESAAPIASAGGAPPPDAAPPPSPTSSGVPAPPLHPPSPAYQSPDEPMPPAPAQSPQPPPAAAAVASGGGSGPSAHLTPPPEPRTPLDTVADILLAAAKGIREAHPVHTWTPRWTQEVAAALRALTPASADPRSAHQQNALHAARTIVAPAMQAAASAPPAAPRRVHWADDAVSAPASAGAASKTPWLTRTFAVPNWAALVAGGGALLLLVIASVFAFRKRRGAAAAAPSMAVPLAPPRRPGAF